MRERAAIRQKIRGFPARAFKSVLLGFGDRRYDKGSQERRQAAAQSGPTLRRGRALRTCRYANRLSTSSASGRIYYVAWRAGSVSTYRRIRACAAAMRVTLPRPRQRQRGGLGCSSRSLKVKTATIAIAATCPRGKSSGVSIKAQQEPAHQTPWEAPKRSASRSAATPKAASSV